MERFFSKVLYEPLGLVLLKWQRDFLRTLYGTVDVETGNRRYWRAYREVPKKNGKSFLIGGLPLYHLAAEGVERPEAYGCASAKDQAAIVFRAAAYLARNNEILKPKLKLLESTKRIVRKDGAGFYAVLSADGDIQDGIEPSLAVIDELHRWKTSKAHTLYQVITKGSISRADALTCQITTAGDAVESPICYREHLRAKRFMKGEEQDGHFYGWIDSADEKRIKDEPEYWKSREARVRANPSHEDNGGFLKDEKIAEELENGKSDYLRYHLNIWGQKEDRWLGTGEWARGNAETRSLMGRPLVIGLDLSATTDFTAAIHVFADSSDGSYDVVPYFWIPRDRVADLQRKLHVPLDVWIERGLITATPGDVVDYASVEAHLRWASEDFELQWICYDPWNATDLVSRLEKAGLPVEKTPQTVTHLSAPMKHIHRKILEGLIRHGGNPVLAWMAESVVARTDGNGNIAPKKPDLSRDAYRIDGFAGLVTAMTRAMLPEEEATGPLDMELTW